MGLNAILLHLQTYRLQVWAATAFSILNKICDILPEVLIGVAVDLVVKKQSSMMAQVVGGTLEYQLCILGMVTAVIWVCESLFEYLLAKNWRSLAQKLQHDLRVKSYGHLQQLSLSWFADKSTGDVLTILNDDINQLERFLDIGFNRIIQVWVTAIAIGGIFFALSPWIAVFAMAPIPLILFGSFKFQHMLAERYSKVRATAGLISGKLANNIQGIMTIKSYTCEQKELDEVCKLSQQYCERNHQAIHLSALVVPVIRMAILAGFSVTLVYGGLLTLRGELEVGSYSILIFLTQRLLWPFTMLGETFDLLQRALASTHRVNHLLSTPLAYSDQGSQNGLTNIKGHVQFENVCFGYESQNILEQVSFSLPVGGYLGIVGPTGSGKSTLLKLLMRFYTPQRGKIRVDKHPIHQFCLSSLRASIGLVSQETFMFDGSIRDNVAYGNSSATDDDIRLACESAEVWDFIVTLPKGLDTSIGERGMKLSGGQRQRLAIARDILKDPPIFIFDEATSAVDNETEAAIQRSIRRLQGTRTIIVVAHRLSTVRHADNILVMNQGKLVEQGSHMQLLSQEGLYQRLWSIQTGR